MANKVDKQAQFELMKALHKNGSTLTAIGKVLGYSGATMSAWNKFDSYEEYTKTVRERLAEKRAETSTDDGSDKIDSITQKLNEAIELIKAL